MLDHLELFVSDLPRAEDFYRTALAPIGYRLLVPEQSRGFGTDLESLDFWIRAGVASSPRPHFAFRCASRELVDQVYSAALTAGGQDNGAPKVLAHISANYYA